MWGRVVDVISDAKFYENPQMRSELQDPPPNRILNVHGHYPAVHCDKMVKIRELLFHVCVKFVKYAESAEKSSVYVVGLGHMDHCRLPVGFTLMNQCACLGYFAMSSSRTTDVFCSCLCTNINFVYVTKFDFLFKDKKNTAQSLLHLRNN